MTFVKYSLSVPSTLIVLLGLLAGCGGGGDTVATQASRAPQAGFFDQAAESKPFDVSNNVLAATRKVAEDAVSDVTAVSSTFDAAAVAVTPTPYCL